MGVATCLCWYYWKVPHVLHSTRYMRNVWLLKYSCVSSVFFVYYNDLYKFLSVLLAVCVPNMFLTQHHSMCVSTRLPTGREIVGLYLKAALKLAFIKFKSHTMLGLHYWWIFVTASWTFWSRCPQLARRVILTLLKAYATKVVSDLYWQIKLIQRTLAL